MADESATHTASDYHLGRLPSGREVTATIHRYAGGPGPTAYVQAAQHGIELNGPATLRRLHEWLTGTSLGGTVVAVPLVNRLAFDHRSYTTPAELDAGNPNLNRVWPGDSSGTLQERMVSRLWELVTDADAVIDLHTGTPDMLEHVRFQTDDDEARRLAAAYGADYRLADRDDTPADESFSGKLRVAASRAGIPAITAELSNSRTVSQPAVEAGLDGVRNVLGELGVLPDYSRDTDGGRLLRNEPEPTLAGESGLFELRSDLSVGNRLDDGEELGAVYCPSSFERRETVTVADGGVAYSLARESVVIAGERLAGVGAPA
ncbi:MAG: succinylglutamate desuccinylase/aspartoacylase family protein [Salinirussus sp.]